MLNEIIVDDAISKTSYTSILKASSSHFRKKFVTISFDVQRVEQLTSHGLKTILPEMNDTLAETICMQELWLTISKGKPNKAPGPDGICLVFFKTACEVVKINMLRIVNSMYLSGVIVGNQLERHIVCLPKNAPSRRNDDQRPLKLLKTITSYFRGK